MVQTCNEGPGFFCSLHFFLILFRACDEYLDKGNGSKQLHTEGEENGGFNDYRSRAGGLFHECSMDDPEDGGAEELNLPPSSHRFIQPQLVVALHLNCGRGKIERHHRFCRMETEEGS